VDSYPLAPYPPNLEIRPEMPVSPEIAGLQRRPPRRTPLSRRALAVATALVAACVGCRVAPQRPSILLVVLDTVRVDDVSAYGETAGTTPTVDALARVGIRYAHAYSNASWTLPSHATLFTGLLPHEHGVRIGSNALREDIPTLAERLHAAGYETVSFSENPWLGEGNHMSRGFERFTALDKYGLGPTGPDVGEVVGDWLRSRRDDRPFFLFVNIMDAHADYKVRDVNPFLPAGVTSEAARHVSQDPRDYICAKGAGDSDLLILRALYRGDVHAADAKLGRVLARFPAPPITVVLSDHGEMFGEHRLVGHDIGLADALLHVPLVIANLPHVAPTVIDAPVQIADLMPTILAWGGAPPVEGLTGRSLPTSEPTPAPARHIVSEYTDYTTAGEMPGWLEDKVRQFAWRGRARCGPQDRVFGDMRSIIAFPYKLQWYAGYAPELFDLTRDREEEHDLSVAEPERVTQLRAELDAAATVRVTQAPQSAIGPELAARLRALGYLGGEAPEGQ
jgi:arylsulfatase A-like enzyme